MSFEYVCKFTKEGWRCDEKPTQIDQTGIYSHDLHIWDNAKLLLDNDHDSYNKIQNGDPKVFKEEFLKHYHAVQKSELMRWKIDEDFLKVYGKIGKK